MEQRQPLVRVLSKTCWMCSFLAFAALVAPFLVMAQEQNSAPAGPDEPEEPDFAFLAGSPYTQVKQTMQIIHQSSYGTRSFEAAGSRLQEDEYQFFQRAEYGITDHWEADLILPIRGTRTRFNGVTLDSTRAPADGLIGIRYRLLNERRNPVTLTMGPQLIFPSGSVSKGTGAGSFGYAWDLAVAKDWRGPVFLYTSANYHAFPNARDPTPGSSGRFLVQGVNFASALGIRAMERHHGDSHHDIHVFLEGAGAREQEVDQGVMQGAVKSRLFWAVSPGIRYGHLSRRRTLIEIGVAAQLGLGPNGPKHSVLIQFQYEFYFRPPKE